MTSATINGTLKLSQSKPFVPYVGFARHFVTTTRRVTNTPLGQWRHLFSPVKYSTRGLVTLSWIPKGCLSFFVSYSTHEDSASDSLLSRLVTSNLLHGERRPLNQDAFMGHLIYLSHPVLRYKGTKDQVPSISIPSVVGHGIVPSIIKTKGSLMLHKDVGSLPCTYEGELCWLVLRQLYTKLFGKRELQLRKCTHQIGLGQGLEVLLSNDWWERTQLTMVVPHRGQVTLGAVGKKFEQALGRKPVSRSPPWFLLQFWPPGLYLSSRPDFVQWWTLIRKCKIKQTLSFPSSFPLRCFITVLKQQLRQVDINSACVAQMRDYRGEESQASPDGEARVNHIWWHVFGYSHFTLV